jgi:hypothetical protein
MLHTSLSYLGCMNKNTWHCVVCDSDKSKTEFDVFGKVKKTRRSYCKSCAPTYWKNRWLKNKETIARQNRNSRLKTTFGITPEDYEKLSQKQNNQCLICKKDYGNNKNKYLSIDHNHDTGEIRGLLCQKCNSAIGLLNEDIELVKRTLLYLERKL